MQALFEAKVNCCGCEACCNICPQKIIHMQLDDEGFWYPQIDALGKCINCKKCEYVCPVKHADQIDSNFTKAYAGYSKKETDIISSSSGGFATCLSKKLLQDGYIIYGVTYSTDYHNVEYIRCTSEVDVEKTSTSKYAQARKYDIYNRIRGDISDGKNVAFFGLPCDTYAVSRFMREDEKLLLISLICHGPTSSVCHEKICEALERKYKSKITSFSTRYKKNGKWKPYYLFSTFANGKVFKQQFFKSIYDIYFQYYKRPSCQECRFRNNHFAADLLIGDCHSAKADDLFYNSHGVSSILPLTKKGFMTLESIKDVFFLEEMDLATATRQRAIHSSMKKDINRYAFSEAIKDGDVLRVIENPSLKKDLKRNRLNRFNRSIKDNLYNLFIKNALTRHLLKMYKKSR